MIGKVHLVRLDTMPPEVERAVERAVRDAFHCPVAVNPSVVDMSFAYDDTRGQYFSTPILQELERIEHAADDRILGLTCRDLFIPVLTFVFGEALLNRPAAILSTRRLSPTFYGLPRDDDLLEQRVGAEAIHELGHTCGLMHCPEFSCAMNASHAADGIDMKLPVFCHVCQGQLCPPESRRSCGSAS